MGGTRSTESDANPFPVVVGPDLTANGLADGFLAKLSADGSSLVYSGFVGGAGADVGTRSDGGWDLNPISVATDASGSAYVAAVVSSDEDTLPIVGSLDGTFNGALDVYLLKYGEAGSPDDSGDTDSDDTGDTDSDDTDDTDSDDTDDTDSDDGDGGKGGDRGCGCASGSPPRVGVGGLPRAWKDRSASARSRRVAPRRRCRRG